MKPIKIILFIFVFSFCSLLQTYNYEFNIDDEINIYDGKLSINTTESSFLTDSINLNIQMFPNSPDEINYYVLTFDMKFREDYESDFDGVCIGPTWEMNKPGELNIILNKENNFKSRIDGKLQEESLRDGCNNYIYYLRYFEAVLSNDKKILYGVATDGHRLAKAGSSIKATIEDDVSVIIPRKGVLEIDKQIDENKELKITVSKNHIQVNSGDALAITKLIDGKFPDYEKVIPKDTNKLILVDCKIFKEALTRVSILSNDRFRGVRLHFENGEIKVSANNPEKEEASDDIKADYSGDSMEVGFNVNYLLDVIGAIRTKNLQIQLKDSNSSALLTPENDPDSSYVVMPLRL